MPLPLDQELLAWAAGFFDGEGTTIAKRQTSRPGYYQLQVSVPQVGRGGLPEVLERFRVAALGSGRTEGPNKESVYCWRARGRIDAEAALALIWPYLGEVKRAQAASAMALTGSQYDSGIYRKRRARFVPTFVPHPPTPVVAAGDDISERAWAAGFLDAEGSFGLIHAHARKRGPDWYRIRVSATQHSQDGSIPQVLLRLQRVVGIGRIECHGDLDDFKWVTEGRDAVLRVLEFTDTWLSGVKLAQAEEALAGFDRQERFKGGSPTTCMRGHNYDRVVTTSSGRTRKYCNACARLLGRRERAAQGSKPRQFKNIARRYLE